MNIGAVIVTFNRKELLLKTIHSLKTQIYKCDHIIIIDNNSSDNTMEYLVDKNIISLPKKENEFLVSKKDNVYYCNTLENKGGAGGFSLGVQKALEFNCDWIWLMDDDICPREDTLSEYMNFIKTQNSQVGAVMGLRYYMDKPFSFETFEHNFDDWRIAIKDKLLEFDRVDTYSKIADFPFEGPLINGSLAKKIGLPNEEFFIIGDDTDYSIRLNREATCFFLPSAKFDRLINPFSSKPKTFDWKQYYMLRNMIYINKQYSKNWKVKHLRPILMLILELKKFVKLAFSEKDMSYLKNADKIFIAFFDGYFSKLGKKYVPGDF